MNKSKHEIVNKLLNVYKVKMSRKQLQATCTEELRNMLIACETSKS